MSTTPAHIPRRGSPSSGGSSFVISTLPSTCDPSPRSPGVRWRRGASSCAPLRLPRPCAPHAKDTTRDPDFLSTQILANIHGLLSSVLQHQVNEKHLPTNPAQTIRLPQSYHKRPPSCSPPSSRSTSSVPLLLPSSWSSPSSLRQDCVGATQSPFSSPTLGPPRPRSA